MSKTIEQVLGYVSLTGLIQAVKTGIPDNLPTEFSTVKQEVLGDAGRYTQVTGTRTVARRANYGAQSVKRNLKDVAMKDVKLIHSIESIEMDPLTLQRLRNYTDYNVQRMGIQEVDRQMANFRQNFDNLRLAATYSMLALGHIYFDASGNLLPTSSGALVDADFGMSANNLNQLNGIITASWANANTDIPLQLRNLKIRAAQLTGYPLKYAFYGVNIPTHLVNNNYVIDYLSRNVSFASKFLEQAEIPDGLFGLQWWPVYTSFYEDANGTNQTFFGADTVVFCPEIDSTVYELLEGTYMVPSSFNATANMASALGSMKSVTGMGAFAVPTYDPPGVRELCFDTMIPVMKVPNAYFVADTVP